MPGEASEKRPHVTQAWQALNRTVVCTGGLPLVLRQEKVGKTLGTGCLRRVRRQVAQMAQRWSRMRGSSGYWSYHRRHNTLEGCSSEQDIASVKVDRPEDAGPGHANTPVGHGRIPL